MRPGHEAKCPFLMAPRKVAGVGLYIHGFKILDHSKGFIIGG